MRNRRHVPEVCGRRRRICGHLDADRFACLLEFDDVFTEQMFISANEEINRLQNAKNVAVKWGIYSVGNQNVTVEQMCDRALLAAAD